MKVCHPSENLASLKTLILRLQLVLELSQIQEILSVYSDLLLFFAEYSFLFINDPTETPVLNDKHSNFEGCFITQDPARDGGNWYAYCNNSPLSNVDPSGLMDTAAIRDAAQQFGPYAGYVFLGMMTLGLLCSPEVRQEVGQAIYDTGVVIKDAVVNTYNAAVDAEQYYQVAKTKTKELTKEQTDSKSTGSYTITFESGKTYSGKGPLKRAKQSSVRESVEHKTLPVNIDWTPAANNKEAKIDEYMRIQDNGGPKSRYEDAPKYNYNIIQSPGETPYKLEHNGQEYPRSIPQNGGE